MVPPVAVAVNAPSERPLQLTLLSIEILAVNAAGSVIVPEEVDVQLLASVIVMV